MQRFVLAYVETGGNKSEAAGKAGCIGKSKNTLASAGASLYKKAVARGLLKEHYEEAVEKPISKDELLLVLTEQALGRRPTSRKVTSRRNKDGYMREMETQVVYEESVAQQAIAKILGLYSDAPKAPVVNILQILGQLPEEQRLIAEAEIIATQGKLLEAQPQGEPTE